MKPQTMFLPTIDVNEWSYDELAGIKVGQWVVFGTSNVPRRWTRMDKVDATEQAAILEREEMSAKRAIAFRNRDRLDKLRSIQQRQQDQLRRLLAGEHSRLATMRLDAMNAQNTATLIRGEAAQAAQLHSLAIRQMLAKAERTVSALAAA